MAKKRDTYSTLQYIGRESRYRVTLAVLVLAWAFSAAAFAQDTACTYDVCALRMSGREVRRGTADERVDGFSFFGGALELPMISGRADSAGINYEAFRKLYNRGAWFQRVAVGVAVAGLIVTVADRDNVGWGMGLTLAGYVPMIWGASYHSRALDRLNRSIWWYNRELLTQANTRIPIGKQSSLP